MIVFSLLFILILLSLIDFLEAAWSNLLLVLWELEDSKILF